jgi:DNA-binding NtrC family response regulator
MVMKEDVILIVDDSRLEADALANILTEGDYEVHTAYDGEKAIEMIEQNYYDIVLTDLYMPKIDGFGVLKYIEDNVTDIITIVYTGYGTIKNAVEATRLGAFEYLTKPVSSKELFSVIKKAISQRNYQRENIMLRKELIRKYRFKNVVGVSEAFIKVFDMVEKVADTDSTVLIRGESGTGKELVARALHYMSYRRDKPFIPVNCGAIPEELLESELFGHEKGAFTNAIKTTIGRFEIANEGTVFLDEIGDMSPRLQVKLLRVLQDYKFERIGGGKTINVDIRIVAATNKNLEEMVSQGSFREDLYYRLNVIPIIAPPLRERISDIPVLANYFLKRFNAKKHKTILGIDEDVMRKFCEYSWPGNVRELENMMERMVILKGDGMLTIADLPESIAGRSRCITSAQSAAIPDEGICFGKAVEDFEKQLILQALARTNWVKKRAAELLQMKRTTLVEKIKKQNLDRFMASA